MSKKAAPPEAIITQAITPQAVVTKWIRNNNMLKFFEGSLIKIAYNVTVNGVYTDPTTYDVTVLSPSGVSTEYTVADSELTKLDDGKFEFDLDLTEDGEWRVKFTGTGVAQVVDQVLIYAREAIA